MRKTGKRLLALLLVVMMVLSSATAVFADEPAVNADGAAVESVVDEAEPAEAAEAEPAEDPAQAEPAAEAEGGAADEATVADSEAADEAGEAAQDPAASLNEAGDIEMPEVPADQDSAIPLEITNNTGMFKAVTASVTEEGGKNCLVVALSSTGYRELFIGTYEEAVANGDNRDNWIHGYQNTDSKWEFKIPLTEGQTYYPVVAISQSYLTKYENGQNPLARAFYPRQMEVDVTAKTLVTGDYDKTDDLAVTNNVKMFKVSKGALQTIGGPNSNGYKSILHLTMGSDSFDKAFIGRADDAAKAAEADIAVIDKNKIFDITVRTMKTAGQPDTIETCIGTPTVMSFHSVSKDAWYERQLTIDESAKTLLIEDAPADKEVINLSIYDEELMFKAVNAYIEKDGSDTFLVFALSAKGYEDIFAGTFDEAMANGKNKDNWIHYAPATVECVYSTRDGEQNDGTAEKYQFRMPVTLNESGETRVPIVAISSSRVTKAEQADPENPDYSAAFTARQALINLDDNSVIFGNYKDTVEVDFTVTVDGKEITDIEMIEDGYDASYEDWTTHEKVESKIPLYVVKVPVGTTKAQVTLNDFCDKYSVYYYTKEPDETGYTQYVDRFIGEPMDETTQLSYTLANKAYDAEVDPAKVIRVQSGYDENWYSENLYAIAFEEAGAIRLFGDTRYNTSLSVAEELKAALGVEKFENIVLATGKKFPDALAGGYLANHKAAPIILINDGNQAVIDYIKANLSDKGTIYILGSEGAIPASWISGLKGLTIKRLGGSDRYATNIEILKEAGVKEGSEILVATGKKFADALSASAVDLPILLVNGLNNSLDKTQIDYLKGLGKCTFHILGGEPAVSKGIENALKTYGSVDRISGPDRYATSVEIARKFYGDAKSVTLAVGTNFPDGLCGGVLACKKGAPLLLTADKKEADAAIPAFTSERGITSGYIYGGDNVLSAAVVQKALGGKAEITEKPYPAAEKK